MAIASKPSENPEFALLDQADPVTGENNVSEPPTTKKNYGWSYLEKPAHNWMNWLHRKTSEWLTYFDQFFSTTHQFKINEIVEYDPGEGVTIEGVILEDDDLTATGNIELDGGISTGGNDSIKLAWKVIEIGDWNMDTTNSVDVAHGLTLGNIRSVNAMIRDDTNSVYYNFESFTVGAADGLAQIIGSTSTYISLTRDEGGFFDSTGFDSTSFNRGWITICYEI